MAIIKISDHRLRVLYEPLQAYFNSVQIVSSYNGVTILRVQGHGAPSDDTEVLLVVANMYGTDIYIIHSWLRNYKKV